jgi:two-component system, NtrC family, sensor histidine kinase PilS
LTPQPLPSDALDPRTGEFATGTVPAGPPPPRALERLTLPSSRTLLVGIIVARLILVALVLGRELGPREGPGDPALGSMVLIAALAVIASIAMFWRIRRPLILPSATELLLQATLDVVVVTAVVTFQTNTAATSVAALYVALVTVYALVLPVGRMMITVALATTCYIAVTIHQTEGAPAVSFWAFWVQVAAIALVGSVIAILGNRLTSAARDQQVLSVALAQARLEADEILGSIQSGVISVDAEGRLGYINPGGRGLLSADAAAFTPGQPVLDALRSRSRDLYEAIMRGITDGARVERGEAEVRRADGSFYSVGLSTTTFKHPGSDRRLVTAIFTDISDLKRLQEFRLRAERLEAVAALSASLAHEIRNPLMAIRSAVEQLVRSAGDDEDDQTLARLVMRESERLNRLLSEFLDFSRVRASKFERISLKALVRDTIHTISEHPAASGVQIAVEGEAVDLDADDDLMNRIVSNLVLNAAQALDHAGRIDIWVGHALPGEAPAGISDRPIKLVVRDNGPGIPDEVRERLFEPFVTGRGVILVDTSPREGTTFSIFLPATWNREDRA